MDKKLVDLEKRASAQVWIWTMRVINGGSVVADQTPRTFLLNWTATSLPPFLTHTSNIKYCTFQFKELDTKAPVSPYLRNKLQKFAPLSVTTFCNLSLRPNLLITLHIKLASALASCFPVILWQVRTAIFSLPCLQASPMQGHSWHLCHVYISLRYFLPFYHWNVTS